MIEAYQEENPSQSKESSDFGQTGKNVVRRIVSDRDGLREVEEKLELILLILLIGHLLNDLVDLRVLLVPVLYA